MKLQEAAAACSLTVQADQPGETLRRMRSDSSTEEAANPLGADENKRRIGTGPGYLAQVFSSAAAAVKRACLVACREPEHSQAYAALSDFAPHETDVKGTAMELTVAASLLLKGARLLYGYGADRRLRRGTVCTMPCKRPALWISRAPAGTSCYMDPATDMPTVAGWFASTPEMQAELLGVFKDLMTRDAGFDILVRSCFILGGRIHACPASQPDGHSSG